MKIKTTAKGLVIIGILVGASIGQIPGKSAVIAGAERAFEKASKTNTGPAPGCCDWRLIERRICF